MERRSSTPSSVAADDRLTIAVPSSLRMKATVRGAKDPVMVGPGETWWSTRTPEGTGTLRLTRTSDASVLAEAWGDGTPWLLHQAPKLLGLDDDLDGFEPTGPVADAWARRPFLLSRTDRPWDALVGAILGQKVQVTKAHQSRRQLARRFGDRAPGPRNGWILPSAATVADMAYHDFHPLGVERKRAEIILRVAKELRRLPRLTETSRPTQVKARLERIRGIGPWTTNMVTAVTMGDPDAVPVGDYHIKNTVAWFLEGEPRATDERMLELLEPYTGHRWRVVRLAKSSGKAPAYGPRMSLTSDGMHRGA